MASTPFAQLVGTCLIYVANVSTTEPAVNATPPIAWTELGQTADDQNMKRDAPIVYFYDNGHQGAVRGVVPQEDIAIAFNLVDLTHQNMARVLSRVGDIVTAAGPPATSRLPLKAGYNPPEYAMLVKGLLDSPFGNFPAQWYIPRGVFEKSFDIARGKGVRAMVAVEFKALEDDTQSEINRLGWTTAQTS